jgi:ribosome-associated translation inhibitor RaiA
VQTPLQLTFRTMTHSDVLATHVGRRAEQLDTLYDRIFSCHVVVELSGHHHRRGDRYRVCINVGLPGHELLVNHDPSDDHDPEDAQVAIERAFDQADRQLEDWVERKRSERRAEARS